MVSKIQFLFELGYEISNCNIFICVQLVSFDEIEHVVDEIQQNEGQAPQVDQANEQFSGRYLISTYIVLVFI